MTVAGTFSLMLLAVLVCGGLSAASLPGNLLYPIWQYLDLRVRSGVFPKMLAKPLLLCNTCMASIWGTFVFWIGGFALDLIISWKSVIIWPIVVIATAFLNHLFWWLYLALHKIATSCQPSQNYGPSSGAN